MSDRIVAGTDWYAAFMVRQPTVFLKASFNKITINFVGIYEKAAKTFCAWIYIISLRLGYEIISTKRKSHVGVDAVQNESSPWMRLKSFFCSKLRT